MSSFRTPLTVTRKGAGSYTSGVWVAGAESEMVILASVQPMRPDEMESLPEGRRDKQAVKIYTSTELFTVRGDNTSPDQMAYRGDTFEVVSVAPYQSGVISHFKAVAVKLDD